MIIIAIIILSIYLLCPIVGKFALLLANSILPDPIPFVDEAIMWIGLLMHLSRLFTIAEFINEHKRGVIWGTIALAVVIILIILIFIS